MDPKILDTPSGQIHYWIAGQGEQTIFFTHGATMDHGMFREQAEYFSNQSQVISWDVPAHGLSRPFPDFSLQGAAEAIFKILDQEGIQKAHLVGQSMGGYISQIASRDNPQRVASLVALDSSPMQPSYYSTLDTWLLSITPALLRLYPYRYLIKTIAKGIVLKEAARKYVLETLEGYTKNEIAEILDVVYQGLEQYGEEGPLSVPVLIVCGEEDKTGKVKSYSRRWAANENRELVWIPNAGHNANQDQPGEFNRILEDYLERVGS